MGWSAGSYPADPGPGPIVTYEVIEPDHATFKDANGCYWKTHAPWDPGRYCTSATTPCFKSCNPDGCLAGGSSTKDYLAAGGTIGLSNKLPDDWYTFGEHGQVAGAKIESMKTGVGTRFYREAAVPIVPLRAFDCGSRLWNRSWNWVYGYVLYPDGTKRRGWMAEANLRKL